MNNSYSSSWEAPDGTIILYLCKASRSLGIVRLRLLGVTEFLLAKQELWRMEAVQHSGTAICTVVLQQEGPGFNSWSGRALLCRVYMFSLCLHGVPLGALVLPTIKNH